MSAEALAAIQAAAPALSPSPLAGASAATQMPGFDAVLAQVGELNAQLAARAQETQALALGEVDNLHQVMMNAEQTRLAFDLMLQIRNKVLDAYQELLRMQV